MNSRQVMIVVFFRTVGMLLTFELVFVCGSISVQKCRGRNSRKVGKPGTRKRSAATRAKMTEAQRARWAKRG